MNFSSFLRFCGEVWFIYRTGSLSINFLQKTARNSLIFLTITFASKRRTFSKKFQEILKYYKDLSDNSQPIMPHKLSKDIFNNKLETALYTIRDFAVIVRDTYRFKTEQILEQKLHWAYGST